MENTTLSPKTKTVWDAAVCSLDWEAGYLPNAVAAATLRAVVRKCVYYDGYGAPYIDPQDLIAIADELEAL